MRKEKGAANGRGSWSCIEKRLKEEHEASKKNLKRKKMSKHVKPKVEEFAQKACRIYGQCPSNGVANWILFVKQVIDWAE